MHQYKILKLLFLLLLIYYLYKNTTETLICPGWETPIVPVSQPGPPGRDKRGCPFVPVGVTNRDKRSIFFLFLFSQFFFLFQLYFCISIKLMYWNSVCKISTNIYIYIVTYIKFVLDSFHINTHTHTLLESLNI